MNDETISRFGIRWCELKSPSPLHHRILFPITDVYGGVVGYSGRSLDNLVMPKYINTSFPKSEHLYGLSHTYKEIVRVGFAYVVEGYFDVLVLWAHGIRNVVAVMGSHLSESQGWLLAKFCNEARVVWDGDVKKEREMFFPGILKQTSMPHEYDPDTYVMAFGKPKFIEYVSKTQVVDDTNQLKSKICRMI